MSDQGPEIEITTEMISAGLQAYRNWESDLEQIVPDVRLGTLVDRVYMAMERQCREDQVLFGDSEVPV